VRRRHVKKILVGVDGSAESRTAADRAAELARAINAELVLAYVVTLPVSFGPELIAFQDWDLAEREHARKLLESLSTRCRTRGITVDAVIPSGAPAETLASMASAPDVELVVVGHRGRGALARVLLGSVAGKLVQISPKPVLVSR
jgi:nucleotide-binding universal stress UspA family protein